MELWAIIPELVLGGAILVLLPLGSFLPAERRSLNTWLALTGLIAAGIAGVTMLTWPKRPVFHETYAVDAFAVYFKIFAIVTSAFVLLATHSR